MAERTSANSEWSRRKGFGGETRIPLELQGEWEQANKELDAATAQRHEVADLYNAALLSHLSLTETIDSGLASRKYRKKWEEAHKQLAIQLEAANNRYLVAIERHMALAGVIRQTQ